LPFFPLQCHHSQVSREDLLAFKMDKRKFLFVSLSGLIGDIAWQVLKEGHDVRYYIEAEKERDIADGFVPKSKDWEKTRSGPTSSFSTTLSARAPRLRPSAPPASR
jgi:hypothetical protein